MEKIFTVVLALVLVVGIIIMMASIFNEINSIPTTDELQEPIELADLAQVPGYDYLYYSTDNQTVYYLFEQGGYKRDSGFMAKYISNGHNCEYVDGQLIEVMDGEIVAVVSMYDLENNTDVVIADLAAIPGYDYLYYSVNTHTVYYLFNNSGYKSRMGFMDSYTSNSHYCEYVDGEIVEVIPESTTN